MSIKDILVSWNATPSAGAALRIARLMARKYDAHLTGVLSYGPPEVITSYASYLPAGAAELLMESDRKRRVEVAEAFRAATADLDPGRTHYRDVFGTADEGLMQAARCHDLIVMGTPEAASHYPHMDPHPDIVARHSGRPVLIVPQAYRTDRLSEHALVAWDGGRAAARALADAMDILETKAEVTLLSIGGTEVAAVQRDAVQHLTRHGIRVSQRIQPRDGARIATLILDAVVASNAGLLVMGAYEHSKFAEDLFGGVTATLLAESPVPVLMSH